MTDCLRVVFWGTRGSIAKPGPATVRYGGNTSCVEVRSPRGTLVILDCGTGAHGLGQALLASGERPLRGHILLSHTHWDHIQGIPFFAPLFVPGSEWDIYAPRGLGQHVKDTLAGQMQYTYFPVSLDRLGASIRYHDLVEGSFSVGDVRVTTQYLNHPALTLGYRLEAHGVVVVYATVHEPHSRALTHAGAAPGPGDPSSLHRGDRRHAEFLAGADLVIHDAQYTAAEYPAKLGWGHSPLEHVVDTAVAAGVKRLALFHHDPLRDDAAVDRLVEAGRHRIAAIGAGTELFAAAEGEVVELQPTASRPRRRAEASALEDVTAAHALLEKAVLVAVADPQTAVLLADAIRPEGIRLITATDGESALGLARREQPACVILDRDLPGRDGLSVCRALRAEPDPARGDVPVVLVVAEEPPDPTAAIEIGVTDWLVKPFSSEYARAKINAWLLRARSRWIKAPLPRNERQRIDALRRLSILDTPPEERFDRLTRLAQRLFDVPIALVSLVDTDRQWFKSCQGLGGRETSRETAFCAHAILAPEPLVVPDALQDSRFADNPLVTAEPYVRFYAGQPLSAPDGSRVGTFCIIDHRPRELNESDLRTLRDLALMAEEELDAGRPP